MAVAPGEEAASNAAIGPPGVLVVECRLEEFLGGEARVRGLPQDDYRRGRHRQQRAWAGQANYGQSLGLSRPIY